MTSTGIESDSRLTREREFHDRAYAGGAAGYRPETSKFYAVGRERKAYYESRFVHLLQGAETLEYGCGMGDRAAFLAKRGARVTAIDLSPMAIEQATALAAREGVAGQIDFRVMDGERLDFPDAHFDVVTGAGILHHLDLDRCLPELARVLKPDGMAVFAEPLGHNAILNRYRRSTPEMRTEDEHPLLMSDLDLLERHFGRVFKRYFSLATVPAFALRRLRGFDRIVGALEALDGALFSLIPQLRRYAWFVVVEVAQPRRGPA